MTDNDVKELFGHYAGDKLRAVRLEAEIKKLEAELKALRAMDADTLRASSVDGMPRRKGGKSDPTGKRAADLADGVALSAEEKRLMERISLKGVELGQLRLDIATVNGWLDALMDRERLIIDLQLVQKQSWRVTTVEYKKRFGDDMSDDTLRRMRDRAISLIARQM